MFSFSSQNNQSATQGFSWKNDTWVKPYLGRYKKTLALALFLGCLTVFFAAALMFTSGWLIGGSAEMPYSILLLGTPLLCVRVFGVGKPILQYVERLTSHNWVLRMTSNLRVKLYRSFDSGGIFFRNVYRLGDALGLLAEDIGHIQNLYLRTIFPTVITWILGLLLVVGFGLFTWWMGLLFLALLTLELVVVPGIAVSINGIRQAKHKALKNDLYTEITDDVMGITDWILSGRKQDFLKRHEQTQKKLRDLEREAHAFDRRRDLVLQILFALGALVVLCWAALQFGGAQGGNSNWILAFMLGYFPLLDAFAPLSGAAVEARSHRDAIERLNHLPDPDRSNGTADSNPNQLRSLRETTSQSSAAYSLALNDVHFAYPGAKQTLIKGISLSITPGEKIAVIGKSGTGKSTLASLLRGDLTPTAGTVTLQTIQSSTPADPATSANPKTLTCSHLDDNAAQYFGVIQQNTYLFNSTLRDNLLIGNTAATDEELVQVLEQVGLAKLLTQLPDGLGTMVDEAGLRFSGGERHRIALARVLLQNVPIVILDEPMVGLDPATEHQVLKTIFETLANKTVIMITHHLQGISYMNRVLLLKDGIIALDGSPTELEKTSEYFRKLIALDNGIV